MRRKDELQKEIEKGGTEPPCPFCGIPRVRRSDYIRCHPCATNWIDGEDLARDPRNQRQKTILENVQATATGSKKREP